MKIWIFIFYIKIIIIIIIYLKIFKLNDMSQICGREEGAENLSPQFLYTTNRRFLEFIIKSWE